MPEPEIDRTAISARSLSKVYTFSELPPGTWSAIKGLVHRPRRQHLAVTTLDLNVQRGEILGFLGPNGAGKTTTIKMLCGLVYPTSGELTVLGFEPSRRQFEFLRSISVVFGQKNMLWWDVSTYESLRILRRIYNLTTETFEQNMSRLSRLLEVEDILYIPVRKLSLGQRMRCELLLALLHDPVLLFADEPTVGLDVVAKLRIREFLARINEDLGTTIVLTSHDMDGVEALCDRVAVIDGGTVIFDGALGDLRARLRPAKEVSFTYAHPVVVPSLSGIRGLISDDPRVVRLEVNRVDVANVLGRANTWGELLDVRIADADLDSVMTELFTARTIS